LLPDVSVPAADKLPKRQDLVAQAYDKHDAPAMKRSPATE
jgi:hypothetical protein